MQCRGACRLTRLNQSNLLREIFLRTRQFVFRINKDRIAGQQTGLGQARAGIKLRQRDLIQRTITVQTDRGIVLILDRDPAGSGQGFFQIERRQRYRHNSRLRHGAPDGHTARVELGNLEAESRVNLVLDQTLEQGRFGVFNGQTGNTDTAHIGNVDRSVILHRIALARVLCGQQPGQLFNRSGGARRGQQHHITDTNLVGTGINRGRQAQLKRVGAGLNVECGRWQRPGSTQPRARACGAGKHIGQAPWRIGGSIRLNDGFSSEVHHPYIGAASDALYNFRCSVNRTTACKGQAQNSYQ